MSQNKKEKVKNCIASLCMFRICTCCYFFKAVDDTGEDYDCVFRDKKGCLPYHKDWDIDSALGSEE